MLQNSTVVGEAKSLDNGNNNHVATHNRYTKEKVNQHAYDLLTICEKKRQLNHPHYTFRYDGDAADAHHLMAGVMGTSRLFFVPDVELSGTPGDYVVRVSWPPVPPVPIKVPKPRKKRVDETPVKEETPSKRPKNAVIVEEIDVLAENK